MSHSDTIRKPCSPVVRGLDLLVALTVLATVLALGSLWWWVLDLFTHFRLQYLAVQLALLGISFGFRRWFWVPVLGIAMLVNSIPLVPYVPTASGASLSQPITLLLANVRAGNRDASRLIAEIERNAPDLVLLLEFTPRLATDLDSLSRRYEHQLLQAADHNFGLALLSRYPFIEQEIDMSGPTAALRAVIDGPSGPFEFTGVHLLPPVSGAGSRGRNAALDALAERELSTHALVCGDFNLSAYSPIFSRFLARSGLRHAGRGRGFAVTWPTFLPPMGIPIDHCLAGPEVVIGDLRRLGDIGSDHYPVLMEFDLESA